VAWTTPIPQILLAMEGRQEWAMLTNPFGSPKPKSASSSVPLGSPEAKRTVTSRLKAAFGAINARAGDVQGNEPSQ